MNRRCARMYSIFNIALNSDIPLPELPEIEMADTVINIEAGVDEDSIPKQPAWFHHWETPEGDVSISCAKLHDFYLLRFPELVDFVVSLPGDTVTYFPQAEVPPESIRHLLLDQVIPRILGQKGQLILHAAAVMMAEGQAIAFLGDSGWGKSTIASSFYKHGARLITDDCLLVETGANSIYCTPNYYGLRLFNDSAKAIFSKQYSFSDVSHYSQKKRVVLCGDEVKDTPSQVKLDAIFLLSDPTQQILPKKVTIKPVRGASEMMELIKQMFVLDVTDKKLVARQFENVGKFITGDLAIYRLDYPRDHSSLPIVRNAVHDILNRKSVLSHSVDVPSGQEVS